MPLLTSVSRKNPPHAVGGLLALLTLRADATGTWLSHHGHVASAASAASAAVVGAALSHDLFSGTDPTWSSHWLQARFHPRLL